jgi:arabinogalactan endo-1,4-beta-galactosidase
MKKAIQLLISLILVASCSEDNTIDKVPDNSNSTFISGVDISSYPEIALSNPTFYDFDGKQKDFFTILQTNGINTIRLKLWVNPVNEHSSFNEVKQFSKFLKSKGFKIWLTLHYSDTWADPGSQETPSAWKGLDFITLKDSVYTYTKKVVKEIDPNYIQIGNEINSGILHPYGHISNNFENFIKLIQTGVSAVRANSKECEIILHFAGIEGSEWFFNQVNPIDYDIIGLSYYPIWHGKSLANLKSTMRTLSETKNKKILIAETAYPFTLQWNDWTHNVVGQNDQLILPDYPATIEGQKKFIDEIKSIVKSTKNGIGFCYWGAESIAWKGSQSTNASSWENQALFDFSNKALPVLTEFRNQ